MKYSEYEINKINTEVAVMNEKITAHNKKISETKARLSSEFGIKVTSKNIEKLIAEYEEKERLEDERIDKEVGDVRANLEEARRQLI